jgi:class 3 adenylate cyclase/tetratricopeptide (TPR) repeat protein
MKTEVRKTCAAIMFSDIAGYTALMGRDEDLAYKLVKSNVRVHQEVIKKHHGKLVKEMGDGVLSSYPSGREAVAAALELQQHYLKSKKHSLRIGIHFGEVIEDAHDVFGDAVNIASRLQTLGHPNSILFSKSIKEDIDGLPEFPFVDLGKFHLKNVVKDIQIYALASEGLAVPKRAELLKLLESRVKRMMIIMVIALIIILMYALFDLGEKQNVSPQGSKTLAILRLLPKSGGIERKRMSEELRQGLISRFSSIGNITVISDGSSNLSVPSDDEKASISETLGANFLVFGTLDTSIDSVFLEMKLYDNAAGKDIWHENFGLPKGQYFSIHPMISNMLISELGVEISESEKKIIDRWYERDMDAFDFYQIGREHYNEYNLEDNLVAIQHFKKALNLDPEFELAWAGLADCYSVRHFLSKSEDYWLDSAEFCANRSIELLPDLAEGYNALSTVLAYRGKLSSSAEYLEKALLLKPNYSQALGNYATFLFSTGNLPEALKWQKKAAGLSPDLYIPRQHVGWTLRLLGRYDEAIEWLNSSLDKKETRETYEQLALCYLEVDRLDKVKESLENILTLTDTSKYSNRTEKKLVRVEASNDLESAAILGLFCGEQEIARSQFAHAITLNQDLTKDIWSFTPIYLGFLKIQDGNKIEGEILLEAARHKHENQIARKTEDFEHYFYLALIHAALGHDDQALTMLRICLENNQFDLTKIKFNPIFSSIMETQKLKTLVAEHQRKLNEMKGML